MSLSIACSTCGAKVRATNKAAGRSFKCPKCGDLLRVPPLAPPPPLPQRITTPRMISVSCPHCNTKLSVEADSSGGVASCPMCGGTFPLTVAGGVPSVQTEPNVPQNILSEEVGELEEHGPVEPEPEAHEPEEQEFSHFDYDDEPWYYGYLEKYARSLKIEGYVIAAISALLATVWFFMFLDGGVSTLSMIGVSGVTAVLVSFLVWILSLVVIVAMLFLWLVGVAAILLVVDTARNIRAMEKRMGRSVGEVRSQKRISEAGPG